MASQQKVSAFTEEFGAFSKLEKAIRGYCAHAAESKALHPNTVPTIEAIDICVRNLHANLEIAAIFCRNLTDDRVSVLLGKLQEFRITITKEQNLTSKTISYNELDSLNKKIRIFCLDIQVCCTETLELAVAQLTKHYPNESTHTDPGSKTQNDHDEITVSASDGSACPANTAFDTPRNETLAERLTLYREMAGVGLEQLKATFSRLASAYQADKLVWEKRISLMALLIAASLLFVSLCPLSFSPELWYVFYSKCAIRLFVITILLYIVRYFVKLHSSCIVFVNHYTTASELAGSLNSLLAAAERFPDESKGKMLDSVCGTVTKTDIFDFGPDKNNGKSMNIEIDMLEKLSSILAPKT